MLKIQNCDNEPQTVKGAVMHRDSQYRNIYLYTFVVATCDLNFIIFANG